MRFLGLEEFGSKSSLRALRATLFDALRAENPNSTVCLISALSL